MDREKKRNIILEICKHLNKCGECFDANCEETECYKQLRTLGCKLENKKYDEMSERKEQVNNISSFFTKDKYVTLKEKGMSDEDIAKFFNISIASFYKHKAQWTNVSKVKDEKKFDGFLEKYKELKEQGYSDKSISEELGIPKSTMLYRKKVLKL